jgi:hypothetical protein
MADTPAKAPKPTKPKPPAKDKHQSTAPGVRKGRGKDASKPKAKPKGDEDGEHREYVKGVKRQRRAR